MSLPLHADFKNVSIVAHYIKERTKNAQFVIISLRNNMFELADRLVGIYKTNNATKSVAINPGYATAKSASRSGLPNDMTGCCLCASTDPTTCIDCSWRIMCPSTRLIQV